MQAVLRVHGIVTRPRNDLKTQIAFSVVIVLDTFRVTEERVSATPKVGATTCRNHFVAAHQYADAVLFVPPNGEVEREKPMPVELSIEELNISQCYLFLQHRFVIPVLSIAYRFPSRVRI